MSILSRAKKALRPSDTPKKSQDKKPVSKNGDIKTQEAVTPDALHLHTILTEKSLIEQERDTLVFKVRPHVTKYQIAQAVIAQGAKPLSIRTIQMRPKMRRRGRTVGYGSTWKKAYVKVNDISKFNEEE